MTRSSVWGTVSVAVILMLANISAGVASGGIRTLNVTDFGAASGDGGDDTPAVMKALEECRKAGPAKLVFAKGRYDFFAGKQYAVFTLDGISGVTIDGQGSEFVVHGITGLFELSNCRDVTIEDFSIDYARTPFSAGSVIAVGERYFDVEVFEEYPVSGSVPVAAYMDYDPKTNLPMNHGLDEYFTVASTEILKPQVLRVNLKKKALIKTGVTVLLRHQIYDRNAFTYKRCSDISMTYVSLHTAPGMALYAIACTDLKFDRCSVIPKPRTRRLMSTTADGYHLVGCRGSVTITNCRFDGMGDDAVNIYPSLYLTTLKKIDEKTIVGAHNLKVSDPPDPGETVEFLHQEDMLRYAAAVVKSIRYIAEERSYQVEFEEPLPVEFKIGDVIGNLSRRAKVHISNCSVRRNRARGFLVQGDDITIEKCRFTDCTSGGVWVIPEVVFFYQGSGSKNVTIRNNIFENCNYGGPLGESVISVYAYLNNFKYPTKPGIHKDILIENNRITGSDNCGIFLTGVDGAVVRGNRIRNACRNPKYDIGHSAVFIQGSRNVRIEGNAVDPKDQGEKCESVIRFGAGCDLPGIKAIGNEGF